MSLQLASGSTASCHWSLHVPFGRVASRKAGSKSSERCCILRQTRGSRQTCCGTSNLFCRAAKYRESDSHACTYRSFSMSLASEAHSKACSSESRPSVRTRSSTANWQRSYMCAHSQLFCTSSWTWTTSSWRYALGQSFCQHQRFLADIKRRLLVVFQQMDFCKGKLASFGCMDLMLCTIQLLPNSVSFLSLKC